MRGTRGASRVREREGRLREGAVGMTVSGLCGSGGGEPLLLRWARDCVVSARER